MQLSIDLPQGWRPAAGGGEAPPASRSVADTGRAGFNAQFLGANRSERIVAYHLRRLGITRLLDVGSNSGQFATTMRRLGFAGVIYSVEPQASAYGQLLAAARSDLLWFPLARQAAGAQRQFTDLRLSENGWSSSLLDVHANHIRADHATRCVGSESIFVNEASRLLHADLMPHIEALKIDVQGYEDRVLDGYLPFLENVRLLLLELSAVECYRGGMDMFALDERLVARHGFSRVSLEPSYYDDSCGVVQQYDGIYFRPDRPARGERRRMGVRVEAVLTSVGPTPSQIPGKEPHPRTRHLEGCRRSWSALGGRVVSVSESPPPEAGIEWVKTESRPTLAQMLTAMSGRHLVLTNADILFTDLLVDILPRLDPEGVYYGHRHDVAATSSEPGVPVSAVVYPFGFDFFLLPPAFIQRLTGENLVPVEFRIGEPWWDYLLPLLALAHGFPLKRFPDEFPIAVHQQHPTNYSPDVWLRNGAILLQCVERLLGDAGSNAASVLRELAGAIGDMPNRLHRVSQIICQALP
ncbi:MAG: FkbM family methyltransferase [Planctomycetia bacterium]